MINGRTKKQFVLLLSAILTILFCPAAFSETGPIVFDYAGVLTESESIAEQAQELLSQTGVAVGCVIKNEKAPENAFESAEYTYAELFGDNTGILLLDYLQSDEAYVISVPTDSPLLDESQAKELISRYDDCGDFDSAVRAYLDGAYEILSERTQAALPAGIPEAVLDYAGILSEEERAELNELVFSIGEQYGCNISIVIKADEIKAMKKEAADSLKGQTNAAVILLSTDENVFDIVSCGKARKIFTGTAKEYIAEFSSDAWERGDKCGGTAALLEGCSELLYLDSVGYTMESRGGGAIGLSTVLLLIIAAAAAAVILFGRMMKKKALSAEEELS